MLRRRRSISTSTFTSSTINVSTGRGRPSSKPTKTQSFKYDSIIDEVNRLVYSYTTLIVFWLVDTWKDLEDMALGLVRWWTGSRASDDAEESDDVGQGAGEIVKLKTRKVKRRRRKENSLSIDDDAYFPGMVNLSGVLCYMNSVLQSMASIASLIQHLERIIHLAVEVDMPTPVSDALSDVMRDLNTPSSRTPIPLRPHALISALQPLPQIRRLLSTREQQDAHELFIVLAEAVSDEALKVASEVLRLRGLAEVLTLQAYCVEKGFAGSRDAIGREKKTKARGLAQPWEGLMSRKRTCRVCGWFEAIRLDTLGGMELPVPQYGDVTLDACLAEYLAPEQLSEVTCEMCSLRETLEFYKTESLRLSQPPTKIQPKVPPHSRTESGSFSVLENLPTNSPTPGPSSATAPISDKRKKKLRDARRIEARLQEMLDAQTVVAFGEPTISLGTTGSALPIKWQKANTDSIREGMITRPPHSLQLHFGRTGYTPYGVQMKKAARVAFPIILDLTRFVSRGVWEDRHDVRQSTQPRKILYRLEAVILHYGYTTSSGHFISIRRKPRPRPDSPDTSTSDINNDTWRPETVSKSCPDGCKCEQCLFFGQVRPESGREPVPGKGWLRISDDEVEEVGDEALVQAGAAVFMCFYEKVGEYQGEESGSRISVAWQSQKSSSN
ncbi:hypothetical protein BCR39DRAFT_517965 [Naematelia encephala]|uniref:ubiquitinyl hydrolase 1 n=1 Tax=Naematelia encephala TaxID=71784 RepID=A0A1Y2BIQ3_9TREE|nr:hypothetical protein BCR39DRAFT_517965 [Naematelia encephala]